MSPLATEGGERRAPAISDDDEGRSTFAPLCPAGHLPLKGGDWHCRLVFANRRRSLALLRRQLALRTFCLDGVSFRFITGGEQWVGSHTTRSTLRSPAAPPIARQPRARSARFDAKSGRLIIDLLNDCTFAVPAKLIEG